MIHVLAIATALLAAEDPNIQARVALALAIASRQEPIIVEHTPPKTQPPLVQMPAHGGVFEAPVIWSSPVRVILPQQCPT